MAAEEKWGYRAKHLVLYNLAENTCVTASRSPAELDAARRKVEDVAGRIAEGKFEAEPGFHCRFCAYQLLCPKTEKHFCGITAAQRIRRA